MPHNCWNAIMKEVGNNKYWRGCGEKNCHFVLTARQMALPVGTTIYQAGRVITFIVVENFIIYTILNSSYGREVLAGRTYQ